MKWTQISEHIWSLRTWMIIPVHVWLVRDPDGQGWTLVDAGIKSMGKAVIRQIERLGQGPLKRVVLTHGHSDHTGALAEVAAATNAQVYAHAVEIPYMEGSRNYPRRKRLEQNVAPGLSQPLPADGNGNLLTIGGLTPYLTPGHSPGHTVYYHEADGVLLAGDLFTSSRRGKRLKKPMAMFTADMNEAVQSARIVGKLKPKRLEVCHGNPVFNPADQIDAYMESAK